MHKSVFENEEQLLEFLEDGSIQDFHNIYRSFLNNLRVQTSHYYDSVFIACENETKNSNDTFYSLVDYAIKKNNIQLATDLIDYGIAYDNDVIIQSGNVKLIEKVFGNLSDITLFKVANENWIQLLPFLKNIEEEIHRTNDLGQTPLMIAISKNHMELATLFIEKYGGKVSTVDKNGNDGLYYYVKEYRNLNYLKKLVDWGGNLHAPQTIQKIQFRLEKSGFTLDELRDWITFLLPHKFFIPIEKIPFFYNLTSEDSRTYKILLLLIKYAQNLPFLFSMLCKNYPSNCIYNSSGKSQWDIFNQLLEKIIEKGYDIQSTNISVCECFTIIQQLVRWGYVIQEKDIEFLKKKTWTSSFEKEKILKFLEPDRKPNTLSIQVFNLEQKELVELLKKNGYEVVTSN